MKCYHFDIITQNIYILETTYILYKEHENMEYEFNKYMELYAEFRANGLNTTQAMIKAHELMIGNL